MNKYFTKYKQALALRDLGFDEPCFGWYVSESHGLEYGKVIQSSLIKDAIITPTYSQAFRWMREKYGLYHYIVPEFYVNGINFNWQILWYLPKEEWTEYNISDGTFMYGDNGEYPTQESAENACLDKLVEIVRLTKP
jgi:hypothetical protein